MNRNTESRFSMAPQLDIKRSVFDRSFTHKTTGNCGRLIPFFVDEMLPGDTFSCDTAMICRMSTPLKPVMDNAYIDIYYFAVPYRLVWEHWEEFNGANKRDIWADEVEYTIPQLTAPVRSVESGKPGWMKGTLADYMGIPTDVGGLSVSALPFRAYVLIWNEWFRDQNTQYPQVVWLDDETRSGTSADSSLKSSTDSASRGGMPLKVAKFHDYFTSCLPAPQKGDPVTISVMKDTPVVPTPDLTGAGVGLLAFNPGLGWDDNGSMFAITKNSELRFIDLAGTAGSNWTNGSGVSIDDVVGTLPLNTNVDLGKSFNLVAKTSELAATTINELRTAFATQRLLERDARGGTRYTEMIRAHFGVTSPDSRLQRPEYLGGKRVPINMNQVLQYSQSTEDSPQGNTAAYSLTSDSDSSFTYSATEHCIILGLAVVRTDHSYQQGLERFWNRKRRFDFYYPELANIGEMAVLNKEIFAQGTAEDDEVFGYQEAWADYRYKPNRISGAFRSTYDQSLDFWHYGDDYVSLPTLSADWMCEPTENMDRTLAVQSSVEDQLLFDFYVKLNCARPMPVYSIPGLQAI